MRADYNKNRPGLIIDINIHIFSFEYIKADKICITHSVPLSNIEKKIYLTRCEIPSENIILLRNNDTIYLLLKVNMH